MVFDRSAGGRLVRFCKLPDAFQVYPNKSFKSKDTCELVFYEGGWDCYSMYEIYEIALLFNVIRMRWWPDLSVSDDGFVEKAGQKIWQYRLVDTFMDENLDGKACMDIFCEEYNRRNPLLAN